MNWLKHLLTTRSRRATGDMHNELNEAIRAGNVERVRSCLQQGASVNCCTLDAEGYHTPLELALECGDDDVIETIRGAGGLSQGPGTSQ